MVDNKIWKMRINRTETQESLTQAKALIFRTIVAVPAVLLKYDLSSVGSRSSLSKDCEPLVLPSFSFNVLKKLGLLVFGLSPTSLSANFCVFPLVLANLGNEKPDMVAQVQSLRYFPFSIGERPRFAGGGKLI